MHKPDKDRTEVCDCCLPLGDDDHTIYEPVFSEQQSSLPKKKSFVDSWRIIFLIPLATAIFAGMWFLTTKAFSYGPLFKGFISVSFFFSCMRLIMIVTDKWIKPRSYSDEASYDRAYDWLGWVSAAITLSIIIAWWIWPNWVLMDIMAVVICIFFFVEIPPIPMKATLVVGSGIMIFDFFIVYFSDRMMTLAHTAIESRAPVMIAWPEGGSDMANFGAIGLGDIIIPAYILKQIWFRAKQKNRMRWITICVLAYFMGVAGAFVASNHFSAGQPALVFIIPSLLLAIAGIRLMDRKRFA